MNAKKLIAVAMSSDGAVAGKRFLAADFATRAAR
jgi:hypothetical protein